MSVHRFEVTDEPAASSEDIVRSMLRDFNRINNADWWAKLSEPANEPKPLNVFAMYDSGEILGGVLGETCLLWLKVFIMAVREDRRGERIGTELLERAESEAIRRGCAYAFLDTLEYQAPDFYKQLEYEVAAAIPNWDSHGHARYYMTKNLTGRGA